MRVSKRIQAALEEIGAALVRSKHHAIYRLPNGRTIVVSKTPSDHRAESNQLRDIRRACMSGPR